MLDEHCAGVAEPLPYCTNAQSFGGHPESQPTFITTRTQNVAERSTVAVWTLVGDLWTLAGRCP